MKLLLVFALCGVTCCLAGSTCSRDEVRKCSTGPPGPPGTEEEELETYCKESRCFLEIYERCGQSAFAAHFPVKGYRKVVSTFCEGPNPMIKKYLDNAECIKSIANMDGLQRLVEMCDLKYIPYDTTCRKIPKAFVCAMNYVIRKCGEEAGEVFSVAALPSFDPQDCMTAFEI